MEYLEEKISLHNDMVKLLDLKSMENIASAITTCYKNNGKLIIFGNGGSAADAFHFAAEFEGQLSSVDKNRRPLPALTPSNPSALTAISNDYDYDTCFLRFVQANARPGDIVIGISTSGNSKNVINAIKAAKDVGSLTVGFTGRDGGSLKSYVDLIMNVPVQNVSIIQEGHIIAYHRICALVVKDLFGYDALI